MSSEYFSATTTSYTGNYYTNIYALRRNGGGFGYDIEGRVDFTDGRQTKSARIIQYAEPYLKRFAGDPYVDDIQIPQAGDTLLYYLRSHYNVRFENVPSNVTIYLNNSQVSANTEISVPDPGFIDPSNQSNIVKMVFAANNTGADINFSIRMRHYSGSTLASTYQTISGTQTSAVTENITVSPSTVYIPKSGGTTEFNITTTASWTITGKPSWLTLSSTAGTGNATITATASSASSGRSVLLTASTSNSDTYVGVQQLGDDELAFTAQDSGSVYWYASDSSYTKTIQYSKNGGAWTSITSSTGGTLVGSVVAGDVVRFRGNNVAYALSDTKYNYFYTTATIAISGYLTSLINPDSYKDVYQLEVGHNFQRLFYDNDTIVDASNLKIPSTKLAPYCYSEMFENTNITSAPSFPMNMKPDGSYVLSLAEGCCEGMFRDCAYLSSISALYVDTLVQGCFRDMFAYCSSLNRVVCMANNPSSDYTSNWLNGVADQGTFVCKSTANWESGVSGIPQGWQIEEV